MGAAASLGSMISKRKHGRAGVLQIREASSSDAGGTAGEAAPLTQ